jgi:ATP adenylyltransferase
MDLYCFENYRTAEQLAEMRRLDAEGVCLFCPDTLRQHGRQRILLETAHWIVTPNDFPYKGTALHLLMIPREHAIDLLDLATEAHQDFWAALHMIRSQFDLKYYGLGVRNGECRFTGATIAHVHIHILVGETESYDDTPVRMRFSSRPHSRGRAET